MSTQSAIPKSADQRIEKMNQEHKEHKEWQEYIRSLNLVDVVVDPTKKYEESEPWYRAIPKVKKNPNDIDDASVIACHGDKKVCFDN